ncbi:hypothetical protein JCM10599A_64450 [Paraburkholderia kururiensis]
MSAAMSSDRHSNQVASAGSDTPRVASAAADAPMHASAPQTRSRTRVGSRCAVSPSDRRTAVAVAADISGTNAPTVQAVPMTMAKSSMLTNDGIGWLKLWSSPLNLRTQSPTYNSG